MLFQDHWRLSGLVSATSGLFLTPTPNPPKPQTHVLFLFLGMVGNFGRVSVAPGKISIMRYATEFYQNFVVAQQVGRSVIGRASRILAPRVAAASVPKPGRVHSSFRVLGASGPAPKHAPTGRTIHEVARGDPCVRKGTQAHSSTSAHPTFRDSGATGPAPRHAPRGRTFARGGGPKRSGGRTIARGGGPNVRSVCMHCCVFSPPVVQRGCVAVPTTPFCLKRSSGTCW